MNNLKHLPVPAPRGERRILFNSDPSTIATQILPDRVESDHLQRLVDMLGDAGVAALAAALPPLFLNSRSRASIGDSRASLPAASRRMSMVAGGAAYWQQRLRAPRPTLLSGAQPARLPAPGSARWGEGIRRAYRPIARASPSPGV